MIGQTFGRLLVLERTDDKVKGGHIVYLCRCSCGVEKKVISYRLRNGNTRSCGCFRTEFHSNRMRTHGQTKHRLFVTWQGMMHRCYQPTNPAYLDYGGRGIFVCDRWHDVTRFIEDNDKLALPNLTLDRRDNNGPYSPENVRWVSRYEQCLNRRSNVFLTHNNKTQTLFEWAREIGIPPRTLWNRIRNLNWSAERALTEPIKTPAKTRA